jgi:hypothetical protein
VSVGNGTYPPLHGAILAVPSLCVVVTEQLPVLGNGLPPSFSPGPLLGVLAEHPPLTNSPAAASRTATSLTPVVQQTRQAPDAE